MSAKHVNPTRMELTRLKKKLVEQLWRSLRITTVGKKM